MKSSALGTVLWLACLGVAVGGGYFAFDLYRSMTNERRAIQRDAFDHLSKPAETWNELKQGTGSINFPNVRLQPGDPHRPPQPKTDGPVAAPEKPKVTLESVREHIQKAFADPGNGYTVIRVLVTPPDSPMPSAVNLRVGNKNPEYQRLFYEGGNLLVLASVQGNADVVDKARDAIISSITSTKVFFQMLLDKDSKHFGSIIKELDEKDWPPDGRVEVFIDVPVEERMIISPDGPGTGSGVRGGGGTDSSSVRTSIKRTDGTELPGNIPLPSDVVPPEEKPDDNLRETVFNPDGSVDLGWGDLTEETLGFMTGYATTYVDADKKPAGVQVTDSLPDDNNLARRSGARPGDVIKSINGVPVTNMSEVRATVIKMRNEGTTDFNVLYIRDGLEQTKTFRIRKKQEG